MKLFKIILITTFITSCGSIPAPSLISPSESDNIQKVSYGKLPENYQKILKDYLIKNLKNYKTAKVEFINEPSTMTIDHLGDTYSGYRVCLSINEQRGDYFIGYRNHFFMINNNSVTLHLFDSGLLTIPFEHCVTRDKSREIYIDDIPEKREDISVQDMDKKISIPKSKNITRINNVYILCKIDQLEYTYVFNENANSFDMYDGENITNFQVTFNDAFINAKNSKTDIKINRVSGSININDQFVGTCSLLDKKKF
tara:strand:+ start:49 stop:813 length:765 start_codon:yes stop_codon:yes gene_type:complete